MSQPALKIENLSVRYENKKTAVDDLSLTVEEGDFIALLGPNGAGKTTTIGAITGLLPFQEGRIEIFGRPAGTVEAKRMIGAVPQELVSHGFFNLEEILRFVSGYHGLRRNQKQIETLMEKLQLTHYRKTKVSHLSGGYKRRMMIAKALVHQPKVLLLDEPSAGVDVELRALLWEFVTELNRQGMTIILTTHYLEEAQRLCRRCAILNHGKLLATDNTGDMIASMAERIVTIHLHRDDPLTKTVSKKITSLEQEGSRLRVVVPGSVTLQEVFEDLGLNVADIADIRTEEGDLENAFLKIIRRRANVA